MKWTVAGYRTEFGLISHQTPPLRVVCTRAKAGRTRGSSFANFHAVPSRFLRWTSFNARSAASNEISSSATAPPSTVRNSLCSLIARAIPYAAAVDAGKKQHDRDAYLNQQTEDELRALLDPKDADANRKEQGHASNLADAQRRVCAGISRLRCPAADAKHPGAAAEDGPAAASAPTDGHGLEIMPEAAEDLLGIAVDVAGLAQRYD